MDLPRRKILPHQVPLWIDPQREIYFITINCQARDTNQLAKPDVAGPLLESVSFRNEQFIWFAHLFLVMPDHVHALISFPPSHNWVGTARRGVRGDGGHLGEMSPPTNQVGTAGPAVRSFRRGDPAQIGHVGDVSLPTNQAETLQKTVSSWKRWTARELGIRWQRDFFEHRLRREESRRQKADYILANPVRKGLVKEARDWPYVFIPGPIG